MRLWHLLSGHGGVSGCVCYGIFQPAPLAAAGSEGRTFESQWASIYQDEGGVRRDAAQYASFKRGLEGTMDLVRPQ